jgi:hypothetical protein
LFALKFERVKEAKENQGGKAERSFKQEIGATKMGNEITVF